MDVGCGGSAAPFTGVGWETAPISPCVHPPRRARLGQPQLCFLLEGGDVIARDVSYGVGTPQDGLGAHGSPRRLLTMLGRLVHTQPPTAVKMFFSLAGGAQPTRSPTRGTAPICWYLLGRRGHPGSPPTSNHGSCPRIHSPLAPSPRHLPSQGSRGAAQHGAEQRATANLH